MVLLMRGLMAAYLLSALLATATPIRRVNSLVISDSDAHEPEIANLLPRAGKRTGPALASDHTKQHKPESTAQQPNALSETPNSDRQSKFKRAESMVNGIRSQCVAIARTTNLDKRETLVKSIDDLVQVMPNLLQGEDEIAVEAKTLLIQGFIFASNWQQNILPSHPPRGPEDTDVSYITKQLKWIEKGIEKERLDESLHMSMSVCLFILAQDMKRFLFRDIKTLFPGIQRLSLNIGKGTLNVKEMSSQLEELGKMLSLAFKVLWSTKEKVAGWTPSSKAKENSKSAIIALEFVLQDVSNDEQVGLKELQRRLHDLKSTTSDPAHNLRLHEFIRGLIRVRIVDQRKLQKELGMAYAEVEERILTNVNLQSKSTDTAMESWNALNTLTT